jgi:hypothetical protein
VLLFVSLTFRFILFQFQEFCDINIYVFETSIPAQGAWGIFKGDVQAQFLFSEHSTILFGSCLSNTDHSFTIA